VTDHFATSSNIATPSDRGLSIRVEHVDKFYGPVRALADASIEFCPGNVHSLVGENGAGKSTLGRIIAGVIRPDGGTLSVDGLPVAFRSPSAARSIGIARVSQEIALLPKRSVVENVLIGQIPSHAGAVIARSAMFRRYEEIAASCAISIRPESTVGSLSLADQARVEIMRAIASAAKVIVLDEPTSAMSKDETQKVLALLRRLAQSGRTVIFVAHSLGDVLDASDIVTVLRDGAVVTTIPAQGATSDQLIGHMIGRSLGDQFPTRAPLALDAPVVLTAAGIVRRPTLGPIDLHLRSGEILGIAGPADNGQPELLRCLIGAERRDSGSVTVLGKTLPRVGVMAAMNAGVVLLPEDRKSKGLHLKLSIRDNICLPHLRRVRRCGFVSPRASRKLAEEGVARFNVRTPSVQTSVANLSGGNQQRVLFAKWLAQQPRVLIASEPTRGVDVAGKRAIYEILVGIAAEGVGVILSSSELNELVGLCDRILVMRDGQVTGELEGGAISEIAVTELAFGERTAKSTMAPLP
jgi:simple sugar transport system ATP-binding protein/ribose transport system ATP-binding protein